MARRLGTNARHSASSPSRGYLDLGAVGSPKRFEWAKMNLDTGAAGNTFPLNFRPDGAGDGRFYRTASVEWIPDGGAWQFQGDDEKEFAPISERQTH